MFLVFRKFWNLLVRKVARSTNREIELTRLFEHISRSLIQLFRRFVASDRVNSKPIRCGLSDYTLPIEKWFHPSSDSCTIFPFFCPICVSSLRLFLLLYWEDERFNFLTRPFLPFKNLHHQLWIWIFASIFQFFIVEVDSSGHERTNLPKLCEHTSKQRTIWIRNVSRN